MKKYRRSTLRSQWWQDYFRSIRFCFRCGGKLVRQYIKDEKSHRHVCRKCREITYLNPKVVAATIPILPNGQVVLLRRSIEPAFGKWTYPAGFQELGETVEEAAVRETLEETGVRVQIQRFQGIYSYQDAGVVTLVFLAKVLRGQKPKLTQEALAIGSFHKNKIPWKELAFRSTTHALKDWRKRGF